MTLRRRLYLTLEPTEKGGVLERIFEMALVVIILLNIISIVLASVKSIQEAFQVWFDRFEFFSIGFFTLEYIARIYSIVEKRIDQNHAKQRVRFMLSPIGLVDLLSFIPFYFYFLPWDLRFLRIFRLMALFRLFKIARYLHALSAFRRVLVDRKEQLFLSFLFILFVLIFISVIMFYAENEAQPTKFSSIPAAMWWGVETLTTVGYGDMIPVTPLGRFLAGIFAIAGVGLLALPAGILSSGFFEVLHTRNKADRKCPHCGGELHD
jgi:voltage-gated potassium channel